MKTFSRTRAAVGSFALGTARSAMEFAIDYAISNEKSPVIIHGNPPDFSLCFFHRNPHSETA